VQILVAEQRSCPFLLSKVKTCSLWLTAAAAILMLVGCQKAAKTDDPQLKPIQQMLDEQLPLGTSEAAVNAFLAARDYPSEPGTKQGTMVAKIRHIDTERVQPVTARVTFYFDENGKLKDYELQRIMNEPIPQ
jgi:uncharacterized lipoprotein NlpE involved in copper resistance